MDMNLVNGLDLDKGVALQHHHVGGRGVQQLPRLPQGGALWVASSGNLALIPGASLCISLYLSFFKYLLFGCRQGK